MTRRLLRSRRSGVLVSMERRTADQPAAGLPHAQLKTLCVALLLALPLGALAQSAPPLLQATQPEREPLPDPPPDPLREMQRVAPAGPGGTPPQALTPGQAQVAEVTVQLARSAFVADGTSRVQVSVELRDAKGALLRTPATITIESTARVLLRDALTDESGPAALDRDRVTPGVQLEVIDGRASFWLLAPALPQDVRLRVTAGRAVAEGVVAFDAELREMLAVGLVEGVIALNRKRPEDIQPVRLDDGFEDQLRSWQRRFSNDRGSAAVRTALFLKGKIRGDALLTLAYDSETDERRRRLLSDVRPDEYYPVYGDSSINGNEALSSSKLFVRIDKDRNYVLYGNFQTTPSFLPLTGGGLVAPVRQRDLGQYNRTLTGLRGHYELPGEDVRRPQGFVNVFVTQDALKQVVEEYPSNGTSGPYAVRNNSALAGSERVELITRDRNNVSVVRGGATRPPDRLRVRAVFRPHPAQPAGAIARSPGQSNQHSHHL